MILVKRKNKAKPKKKKAKSLVAFWGFKAVFAGLGSLGQMGLTHHGEGMKG